MTSVSFSLKNAINRDNNPTSDGLFAYGKYSQSNVFTLFTDYEYTDGSPLVLPTFDNTKVLAWKGSSAEYPHLGFENIQGNLNITPQPFPEYGIYLHPFYSTQRDDVGVRFNCPVTANVSVLSKLQKKDQECGDGIGYRILKNGGEAQTRQVYPASDNPHNITTNISVNKGDILDFIVDVGDNSNSFCDDVALEVLITVSYDKLSAPIITDTYNCTDTEISGNGYFIPSNCVAVLYDGSTRIATAGVTEIGSSYLSNFKFTGLSLSSYGGKQLKVRFESSTNIPSDYAAVNIDADSSCFSLKKPIIKARNKCKLKSKIFSTYNCVSVGKAVTAIVDKLNGNIIATGVTGSLVGGVYNYIAYGNYLDRNIKSYAITVAIGYIDRPIAPNPVVTKSCLGTFYISEVITGEIPLFNKGILLVYLESAIHSLPVFTAPINNGKFELNLPSTVAAGDYVLYGLELEF